MFSRLKNLFNHSLLVEAHQKLEEKDAQIKILTDDLLHHKKLLQESLTVYDQLEESLQNDIKHRKTILQLQEQLNKAMKLNGDMLDAIKLNVNFEGEED